jgi:DNA polymerase
MTTLETHAPLLPRKRRDTLAKVREDAAHCRRCPLWKGATQTVFGEGPARASLMLVGEQPGDAEDIAGRPFVGPAGKMLDKALIEAGIGRGEVYLTNAVKHFKNEPRGKRRLHKRPNAGEIEACRWWLDKELRLVRPRLVVALGASAAAALLGRRATISKLRGRAIEAPLGRLWIAVHPSYLLRIPDEAARHAQFDRFVKDLTGAKAWLKASARTAA